jgi:hypothetical protein
VRGRYQSPFSPAADSVSTTTRNSLRASFGSSSFRADVSVGLIENTFCVVVAVFDINVRLVFFFILVDEVVVNYDMLASLDDAVQSESSMTSSSGLLWVGASAGSSTEIWIPTVNLGGGPRTLGHIKSISGGMGRAERVFLEPG